jgi:hypothetical protein
MKAVPTGWGENPTAWPKRVRLIVLASLGLCVASYLTLYQLGVFATVWDPFFPNGSAKVLGLMEPVPDAALGATAYLAEIFLSLIGGEDRWRSAPWTVLALGFVIACGAVVSMALVIIQPVVVGAWCTLCLASAAVSFAIFFFGYKEPLAGLMYLMHVRDSGGSAWRALWGLKPEGGARG